MSRIINSPSIILRCSVSPYNLLTLESSFSISTVVTEPLPPIPAYNLNVIQFILCSMFKSLPILSAKSLDITPCPSNALKVVSISFSTRLISSIVSAVSTPSKTVCNPLYKYSGSSIITTLGIILVFIEPLNIKPV